MHLRQCKQIASLSQPSQAFPKQYCRLLSARKPAPSPGGRRSAWRPRAAPARRSEQGHDSEGKSSQAPRASPARSRSLAGARVSTNDPLALVMQF